MGLAGRRRTWERDKSHGFRIIDQFEQLAWILLIILPLSSDGSHIPVTSDPPSIHLASESTPEVHIQISNPSKQPKRLKDVFSASCENVERLTVFGIFPRDEPFKGRIYANDYPDEPGCGMTMASGKSSPNVTFDLRLGECGLQMNLDAENSTIDSMRLSYKVTLYVQYSAFLQQAVDERVTVSCVHLKSYENDTQTELDIGPVGNRRRGRGMNFSRQRANSSPASPTAITQIGEAVMEIISGNDPSPKSKRPNAVSVGEDVTIVISTKVLRGYDARVVNCTTHDGSRSSMSDGSRLQPILDSAGCSVDRNLVPDFRRRRLPVESRNRLITLHWASFPAFKFPDRDHLHIQCGIAYCQGPCPQESCDSNTNHFGAWKGKYGRIANVLIDTSQVVNSIEVMSPDLDSPDGHHYEMHQSPLSMGSSQPDRVQEEPLHSSRSYVKSTTSASNTHASKDYQYSYTPNTSSSSQRQMRMRGASTMGSEAIPNGSEQQRYIRTDAGGSTNVCVSPGTVILSLVALAFILVISITATLWFALKRSEMKRYSSNISESSKSCSGYSSNHSHGPVAPYYRFSHW